MDSINPDPVANGPLPAYQAMLSQGTLQSDNSQRAAAEQLQELWIRLRDYNPPPLVTSHAPGFLGRLLGRGRTAPMADAPRGLYLVGEVGRGKSMLMDLFFAAADLPRKKRIHFHRFMQQAHARVHAWKKANPNSTDPIPPLADSLASEAALLCFDEFQVNDIADAMILGRLFEALFQRGVVVVATSNIRPDDLFKGQPGRDAFLPFIAIIKDHLDVVMMDDGRDFRRERLRSLRTWHVPSDMRADQALDEAFAELSGHAPAAAAKLTVNGRALTVPLAADGVARFDFASLCGSPLGPGDYLAIAAAYHTVLIDGIPRLGPDQRNEAKRFITLIDIFYERHVKVFASAEAEPEDLYSAESGAEAFEFARAASRLHEMRSREYLSAPRGRGHAVSGNVTGIVET